MTIKEKLNSLFEQHPSLELININEEDNLEQILKTFKSNLEKFCKTYGWRIQQFDRTIHNSFIVVVDYVGNSKLYDVQIEVTAIYDKSKNQIDSKFKFNGQSIKFDYKQLEMFETLAKRSKEMVGYLQQYSKHISQKL